MMSERGRKIVAASVIICTALSAETTPSKLSILSVISTSEADASLPKNTAVSALKESVYAVAILFPLWPAALTLSRTKPL